MPDTTVTKYPWFSTALSKARQAVPGLTQAKLGATIGEDGAAVARWESGRNFPARLDDKQVSALTKALKFGTLEATKFKARYTKDRDLYKRELAVKISSGHMSKERTVRVPSPVVRVAAEHLPLIRDVLDALKEPGVTAVEAAIMALSTRYAGTRAPFFQEPTPTEVHDGDAAIISYGSTSASTTGAPTPGAASTTAPAEPQNAA